MQDILLIDKPKGVTSFDCIRILRKKLHANGAPTPAGFGNTKAPTRMKMGHAGTLDPMATGLMIIGVGEGTKMLGQYLKLPKTYDAEVLLGVRTDTGDVTGRELPISNDQFPNNNSISKISNEEIEKTLNEMVGKLLLPVPAYSAIKRGGEALYKKARRGEVVDTPIKTMEITATEFLSFYSPLIKGALPSSAGGLLTTPALQGSGTPFSKGDEDKTRLPVVSVRFSVSSGTYIRSLAEELGRRLGVPATLAGLRRTRIGEFKVEDAQKIDPQS